MTTKITQLSRSLDAIGSLKAAIYQIQLTAKVSTDDQYNELIRAERRAQDAINHLQRYRRDAQKRPDTGKQIVRG